MEEKLKSISGRIPWSLLLRAVAFGVGWLILPFWAFLILAVGIYFLPVFQVWKLFFPFILTLILAFLVPSGLWAALFLSALFFFILGVKDLVLIDRTAAFRFLLYIFLFIAFFYSFSRFDYGLTAASFFWFFALSLLFSFLLGNFFVYSRLGTEKKRFRSVALALLGMILFELSLAVLFLPLNFLTATILVFTAAVILFELASDYFSGRLTSIRIMSYGTIFFVIYALLLSSQSFSI
jgi:hypothetical protein